MDRNARSRQPQRRKGIERRAKSTEAVEFFNVLTSPEVLDATEALSPEHRERLYPPTVTLSMFMRQTLEADGSCQKAVNRWAAQRVADGLCPSSTRTGGYCRARARLPLSMVSGLAQVSSPSTSPCCSGSDRGLRQFERTAFDPGSDLLADGLVGQQRDRQATAQRDRLPRQLLDKPSLVFVTDGHEAPPVDSRFRRSFDDKSGEVAGLIVGVGDLRASAIPKIDP